MPDWIARHAAGVEIGVLVADRTAHGRRAETVFAAFDRRLMQPVQLTVALARAVAGRMAVHAARIAQHFADLGEQRRRARRGIADCRKAIRRREAVRRAVRRGVGGKLAQQQCQPGSEELVARVYLIFGCILGSVTVVRRNRGTPPSSGFASSR